MKMLRRRPITRPPKLCPDCQKSGQHYWMYCLGAYRTKQEGSVRLYRCPKHSPVKVFKTTNNGTPKEMLA